MLNYNILTEEQINDIIEAGYKVMEEVGMDIHNEEALVLL